MVKTICHYGVLKKNLVSLSPDHPPSPFAYLYQLIAWIKGQIIVLSDSISTCFNFVRNPRKINFTATAIANTDTFLTTKYSIQNALIVNLFSCYDHLFTITFRGSL